ncbi:MAG: hypothetical protein JNL70_11840 [Saprospiraceae bacterium]|nr:hypothetical protein [Saprospiraceae bacterium]
MFYELKYHHFYVYDHQYYGEVPPILRKRPPFLRNNATNITETTTIFTEHCF